jgi:hypothetical protein
VWTKKIYCLLRASSPKILRRFLTSILADSQGYIIVVLSGDEGPLEAAFSRELKQSLERRGLADVWEGVSPKQENPELKAYSDKPLSAVDLYRRTAEHLVSLGYKGIFVAYDEFGKVLEAQQANLNQPLRTIASYPSCP